MNYRTRARKAVRDAGGKIPLSFDYVLSAEHTEHFNSSQEAAAAASEEDAASNGGGNAGAGAGTEETSSVFTATEKMAMLNA